MTTSDPLRDLAIATLREVCTDETAPSMARVEAATVLFRLQLIEEQLRRSDLEQAIEDLQAEIQRLEHRCYEDALYREAQESRWDTE